MVTASRFRVVVGLTSALLCHTRFPTVDSPSQDTARRRSHCRFFRLQFSVQVEIESALRRTRSEENKTWSLCCNRCIRRLWLSRVTRRTTLLPTRGRIHWRHGGGCRRDTILQQEERRKRKLLLAIISPGCCSLLELQAGIERSYESRYEKKSKNKMDDEIKLTGLEALVPEELEKHLILNSNRLRTF